VVALHAVRAVAPVRDLKARDEVESHSPCRRAGWFTPCCSWLWPVPPPNDVDSFTSNSDETLITAPAAGGADVARRERLIVRLFFARNMSGRFELVTARPPVLSNAPVARESRARGRRRFYPNHFKDMPAETFRVMVIGDPSPRGSSLASSYPVLIAKSWRARESKPRVSISRRGKRRVAQQDHSAQGARLSAEG